MSIGERIKMKRLEYSLTQSQVAERLKMEPSNFSSYERDKSIPPSNVLSVIADILHTSTDYLLERTDDPTPQMRQLIYDMDLETIRKMTDEEDEAEYIAIRNTYVKRALNEKTNEVQSSDNPYKDLVSRELQFLRKNYSGFANSQDIVDLKKFLGQSEIMFDGVPMNKEDIAKIQNFMEFTFLDAIQKNKKGKKNK